MNDQDIITTVAKLDGRENAVKVCLELDGNLEFPRIQEINYLTSRDAIIPVIKNQSRKIQLKMIEYLSCEFASNPHEDYLSQRIYWALTLTPKQLAIALVKACGKWEE